VSGPELPGNGDPSEGIPFLGDLGKLLGSQGPLNLGIARQVAVGLAGDGAAEPNVDPQSRMALEELARVAELRVSDATGMAMSAGVAGVEAVNRTNFAHRTLQHYEGLLTDMAVGLTGATEAEGEAEGEAGDDTAEDAGLGDLGGDPMAGLFDGIQKMMGPVLMGLNAGFMVGHVARRAMGQYELPLPRPEGPVLIVVPNVDQFADEWSLPVDEVRLWVCVSELAQHAVVRRPHVARRILDLVREGAAGFEIDMGALEERMAGIDPSDPESFQTAFADPEILLGALNSPRRAHVLPQLEAITSAVVGYVDWVLDTVGPGLIGSYEPLAEALRRRRVEASAADRMIERLLGLELDQAHYERGAAFVDGVVDRAGPQGLVRLWASERELPTPAEIDAPGLWLARIDLPPDAS
jgi:putative hydrolase